VSDLGPALTMVANKLAVHPLPAWLIFASRSISTRSG
jgi:hypothetical protein